MKKKPFEKQTLHTPCASRVWKWTMGPNEAMMSYICVSEMHVCVCVCVCVCPDSE